ncbi:hypothetical protein [Paraliomyxa miuraensis]|uniref:hypothetical protein n=1 Tax=Paraliomyxa miuraensis TaxID=376150 RepID=UPI002259DE1C|nr:hypothetical protein [Paraliomyxa miuraensis]MCX4240152.1 hypothetical protein [Paraliomyxa miuraensis]
MQADLHSVVIGNDTGEQPAYITEWIENLPSRGWPAQTKTKQTITTVRTRDGKTTEKSSTSNRGGFNHVTVEIGHPTLQSIVLGTAGTQDGAYSRRGFLEFHAGAEGLPAASQRRIVRRSIEFALGTSIAAVGWTEYDRENESLRSSMSHSYLPSRSHHDMPPALFHPRYQDYIDEGIFGAYVRSFLEKNSDYELDRVVWLYFHAQSAPLDMAAVYVGAAYEVLRRAHYKRPENEPRSRLLPKDQWRSLSRAMRDAAMSSPDYDESHRGEGGALGALLSKIGILNEVSGIKLNLLMLDDLGLGHGEIEKSALAARNDAAHANPIAPGEEHDVLKRYRALHTLVARVLFSILGMTVNYRDYSSAGFPFRRLAEEQGTTRAG